MDKLEEFLKFEKENNLFDYTYNGICLWALVRGGVFLRYYTEREYHHPDYSIKNANPGIQHCWLDRFRLRTNYIKLVLKHIFHRVVAKKKDVFCSNVNIYKIINGERVDPFMDFFRGTGLTVHYHTRYNHIRSYDIIHPGTNDCIFILKEVLLNRFYGLLGIERQRIEIPEEIRQFVECLSEKLSVQIDREYKNQIVQMVRYFVSRKSFFKKLLKNRCRCVVHGNYANIDHMALISAARELGIPTVELQHGVAGKKHLAYNFLDASRENKYLPDYFFTWGDYWTKTVSLPEGTTPISVGFPQMDVSRNYLKDVRQNEKHVIFYSSQIRALGILALDVVDELAELGFTVKYKLHPNERKFWRIHYPELNTGRIEVLDEPLNVHELLASAKFHIGINSTVLFEALAFDAVVLVYDIDDIREVGALVEMGYAHLFDSKEALLRLIVESDDASKDKSISEKLFKQNAVKNIESELIRIMSVKL